MDGFASTQREVRLGCTAMLHDRGLDIPGDQLQDARDGFTMAFGNEVDSNVANGKDDEGSQEGSSHQSP